MLQHISARTRMWRLFAASTLALLINVAPALHAQRNMENLGRGVVAVRSSSTQVLVTWRLLGLDPSGIGFNVYRSANGGAAVKLNGTVLTAGTNYTDTTANLTQANAYHVRPVIGGVEQAASGSFNLTANHAVEPIVRIPLSAVPGTGYYTKFVWVGDLDGDSEYDYVIDRLAPFDPNNNDIGLGNQYVEGYKRDGTRLWRIDMGPNSTNTYNIEPGSSTISMGMYDGITVCDLNSDGKAEVVLKISNGVRFPNGTTFTNSNNLLQFIAVIDGMTGNMITNAAFPTDFLPSGSLGTQLGIGYANGINPTIYLWGRNRNDDKSFNDVFCSYSWNGAAVISQNWKILLAAGSTTSAASHQMRILDVNGDGKDEVMTGNFCVNSDGTLRYLLPGVGHGDRFHITKMDPTRAGLQGYGIQQNNSSLLWEYYYDATTGAVLWSHFGNALADIGRGLVGDVDSRKAGFEVWSVLGLYNGPSNTLAEPNTGLRPYPTHSFWWDGDVLTEGLNDYKFEKWDPLNPTPTNALPLIMLMSDYGAVISGHNPMFFGDIMGDWRTEVIATNAAFTELMIFTTNIPSTTRLYTMAHNPAYRNHLTIKGYMQSAYVDYFLGSGMATPPAPNIRYVLPGSGVTIQAETATIAGGTLVKTDRAGYRGTGFLDFPGTGGSAQLTGINGGSGGSKTIVIRFANGGATPRTGRLLVNGVAQNITFATTGGWTNWATHNVTIPLNSGYTNTIRFESNGQDLGNIDEITIP